MNPYAGPIWDAWTAGGPFIGDAAPHGRVTVEKDWHLNLQQSAGTYQKCPIRWYQRYDNCVDDQTEMLTKRGWLRVHEIEPGDECLGIGSTGVSVWQPIDHLNVSDGTRPMLGISGTCHDSLTTMDHRWLTDRYGKPAWRTSATLDTKDRIPMCAPPGHGPDEAKYEDDFVSVVGWFFTEGYRRPAGGGEISQSITVNPGQTARIRALLSRLYGAPGPMQLGRSIRPEVIEEALELMDGGMGLRAAARQVGMNHSALWHYRHGHRPVRPPVWQEPPPAPTGVVKFGLSKMVMRDIDMVTSASKAPTPEFLCSLNHRQLSLFLEAAMAGDGWIDRNAVRGFGQANVERINAFEMACALAGIATARRRPQSVRRRRQPMSTVTLLRRTHCRPILTASAHPSGGVRVQTVMHTGTVWCPTVRTGSWLARRNGKVYFTGNSQVETEVPNIKQIDIDRSVDTDAASCTLTVYNQKMLTNAEAGSAAASLGQPGYFTWRFRGTDANARWGVGPGEEWRDVLVPNALLRTYQGYGGLGLSIADAVAAGNLVITGTWLVDSVHLGHDGMIEIKCRDMAKLLIEQHLYPPLVPNALYPHGLTYCRWSFTQHPAVPASAGTGPFGNKRCVYDRCGASEASATDCYYGFDGGCHGHHPHEAFDGDASTFWLSVGNDSPEEPFAVEWIEACCGDEIDNVYIHPWAGGYRCYISVMENGAWADGGLGNIAYSPAGIGIYTGINTAVIPYVAQAGIPADEPTRINLPRVYRAEKVRFTLTNLYNSQWGPYHYRAGVRQLGLSLGSSVTGATSASAAYESKDDGNYKDWAEIIKDLALWSGFYLYEPSGGDPQVHGNIQPTGGADTGDCIKQDQFAKKTVIDAMHQIRDIVAFVLRVDEEGGFRFEPPNYWAAGNYDKYRTYIPVIPEIDEAMQMTSYTAEYSDKAAYTDIIISSNEPTKAYDSTVTTHLVPADSGLLRGIVKPLPFFNKFLTDAGEQLTMARLIDREIRNSLVGGSVGCAANPCIGIDDQVRIHERVTSETGIHYITGYRTSHDLDSGSYLATLTTYRVGDEDGFVVTG